MKFEILIRDDDSWSVPQGKCPIGVTENSRIVTERYEAYRTYESVRAELDTDGKPVVVRGRSWYPPHQNWFDDAESWTRIDEKTWERQVQIGNWYLEITSLEDLAAFYNAHSCGVEFAPPQLLLYDFAPVSVVVEQ